MNVPLQLLYLKRVIQPCICPESFRRQNAIILTLKSISHSLEYGESTDFLLDKKFLLKSDHNPLEYLFNSREELPRVTWSRILRWAIIIMAFDFWFWSENGEEHENSEERIIEWMETDVLSRKTLSRETQRDPILSGIFERIRKNVWSNCTLAERLFKKHGMN